jgi:hypothetical protein
MSSNDDDFPLDEDYLVSLSDDVSGEESLGDISEPPRSGLLWVRKHNHEVVGDGAESSPEPENNGVVRRHYFSTFDSALTNWGKFNGTPYKRDVAQGIIDEVATAESTIPHEYFFVTSDPSYLAVVMKNSGHRGRVWLRKTVIHAARQVKNSQKRSGKNFYEVQLSDYSSKSVAGSTSASAARLMCTSTGQYVPLSGKCDCGDLACPYFSD